MAEISVKASQAPAGWTLEVVVQEGKGKTQHTVSLTTEDFQRLTQGKQASPEVLVKKSFEFLLTRESKESILRQFDLPLIGHYFPDYPDEIRRRL